MGEPTGPARDPELTERVNTHTRSVRMLSTVMARTAVRPALVIVVLAALVAGLTAGVPGLLSALIGGAVGFASMLSTIGLMRATSAWHPVRVMGATLVGYVLKMVVLLLVMNFLAGVDGIRVYPLGGTLLAAILVCAGAQAYGFRKARVPTPRPGGP